ncbi:MAG: winged helix-turn-helix domain-containing protein, partial [Thermicanus sp.]|nr:winged helix-turn-helix domain-containing protein [Thermicanus sp.]
LYCDGLPIILTRKEFSLIEYLFHHQDEVISPEELMEHVWNEEANPFSNVIRVHITSLRKKIMAVRPDISVIENIPGVGYRLSRQLKETV